MPSVYERTSQLCVKSWRFAVPKIPTIGAVPVCAGCGNFLVSSTCLPGYWFFYVSANSDGQTSSYAAVRRQDGVSPLIIYLKKSLKPAI
jgi:hypothetical protein